MIFDLLYEAVDEFVVFGGELMLMFFEAILFILEIFIGFLIYVFEFTCDWIIDPIISLIKKKI